MKNKELNLSKNTLKQIENLNKIKGGDEGGSTTNSSCSKETNTSCMPQDVSCIHPFTLCPCK